jgi:Ca2+-binding RTX toxin-like protein
MTTGTPGNDTLTNDRAVADEVVNALAGDDQITIQTPHDPNPVPPTFSVTVHGGDGLDTLSLLYPASNESPRLIGRPEEDSVWIRASSSLQGSLSFTGIEKFVLSGRLWSPFGEILRTGSSADWLTLYIDASGLINSGAGADTIRLSGQSVETVVWAGDGNDVVHLSALSSSETSIFGEGGNDILYFGNGPTALAAFVDGGAGRDILALQGVYDLTSLGPDSLRNVEVIALMTSTDNAYGGATGSPNRYTLQSQDANVAAGQTLTIEARALAANESAIFYGSAERDGHFAFYGGAASDYFEGGSGNDRFDGGLGADTMIGNLGNDVFFVNVSGDVVMDAGAGFDSVYTTVSYTLHADAQIELLATTNSASNIGVTLTGNRFAQTITGTAGSDVLRGNGGNDYLIGNAGNDQLTAGGRSVLAGGAGDDTYFVTDWLQVIHEAAGGGFDTIYTQGAFVLLAGVAVELLVYQGAAGVAYYGNDLAQTIRTGAGNDSAEGRGGNDHLVTYGGNDFLDGGAGADVHEGGEGSDVYFVDQAGDVVIETGNGFDAVYASSSYALAPTVQVELLATTASGFTDPIDLTGSDTGQTIVGNAGVNMLSGRAGNDSLKALEGDDVLDGGNGVDILEGGAGADVFRFAAAGDTSLAEGDQIRDFISGIDRIDLRLIDADTGTSGDQAFSWIGSNAFSGGAGQLRMEIANGQVYVSGDVNGDAFADFAIVLNNTTTIVATDLML